jgi:CRP/FNR family transcriptional regulator
MKKFIFRDLFDHPKFEKGVYWTQKSYQANDTIFSENDLGEELYFIFKGSVRIFGSVTLDEHKNIHPGFCDLVENDIFGEMCLFDKGLRSAGAVAITDTELAVMNEEKFIHFLEQNTDIGFFVIKHLYSLLVQRLRSTNKRFSSIFA